jgi:hypothetical protein
MSEGCYVCGYIEDGGNVRLDCGHYMCDEHLLQGEALDHAPEDCPGADSG